ncbi:MAG: hypothetical protein AAB177_03755 [Nitrospirota bacterium]
MALWAWQIEERLVEQPERILVVGYDYESRAVADTGPIRVATMKQSLRVLWLGHIFSVQHAVLYNATSNLEKRDAAEKEVVANAKEIAITFTPFYGEARAEQLFTLLRGHYVAVKEYSEATVVGSKLQQDAALAHLASNADDIAVFFNGVNPNYLPKDTVRGLIAAHGAHHVLQINQYQKKQYAQLEASWPMMRQHVYVIADTLMTALVEQFPDKFS